MSDLVNTGNLDLLPLELREALRTYYTSADVWEASLLARRSAAGLSVISTRYVRIQRSADGSEAAEELTSLEQETLLRSLDLIEVRLAATAEINATEVAIRFLESLLRTGRELILMLEDEAQGA